MITALELKRRSKATRCSFLFLHFEGCLASGPNDICKFFADFIQQTYYADDIWVPSDAGPDLVHDDPPFNDLQFTSIPPLILNNCASAFTSPLSLITLPNK
jgi:hypothetical protein